MHVVASKEITRSREIKIALIGVIYETRVDFGVIARMRSLRVAHARTFAFWIRTVLGRRDEGKNGYNLIVYVTVLFIIKLLGTKTYAIMTYVLINNIRFPVIHHLLFTIHQYVNA